MNRNRNCKKLKPNCNMFMCKKPSSPGSTIDLFVTPINYLFKKEPMSGDIVVLEKLSVPTKIA